MSLEPAPPATNEPPVGAPKINSENPDLTVYFDGACPLCSREIDFYQKRGSLCNVEWVDVSACPDSEIPSGLTREKLLARFHVSLPDGTLSSGPKGFGQIWMRMKGMGWAGRLLQINSLQPVLEFVYKGFLSARSVLAKRMSK